MFKTWYSIYVGHSRGNGRMWHAHNPKAVAFWDDQRQSLAPESYRSVDGTMLHLFYTSTKSWRSLYFHCSLSVCLCVCLSVCVCVCVRACVRVCVSDVFLWTKFQPNGWTDLDAFFAKRLLIALARTLLKLVYLGQKSWSQWHSLLLIFS